jgi:hypothetical protein
MAIFLLWLVLIKMLLSTVVSDSLLRVDAIASTFVAGITYGSYDVEAISSHVSVQGLDPGEIWILAVEVAPHRFDQNWEGELAAQVTRFPH